jgi:hypothetical protein
VNLDRAVPDNRAAHRGTTEDPSDVEALPIADEKDLPDGCASREDGYSSRHPGTDRLVAGDAEAREDWRRAGDSNSHGPCGPVDFKSTALPVEASPPGPCGRVFTLHQP